jgi:large repetitive protein
VPTSENAYTYRIRGHNKAGWGEWSAMSAPRRGVIAPAPPQITGVVAGDRQLTVGYSPGSRGGARADEVAYQYRLNGGGWAGFPGGGVIGGLANGTSYTVEMRAVATVDGTTYAGGVSNSVREIPYGAPRAPVATARNLGQSVELSWNSTGSDNGRPIQTTQIRIDGGSWQNVGSTGSRTVGDGYQQTHSIDVRAQDSTGTWSPVASDSARTDDPPPPQVFVTQGDAAGSCVNGCRRYVVNWNNLNIGNATVWCYSSNDGRIGALQYTINFDGQGSQQIGCYVGRDGQDVWIDIQGWGDGVDTEKRFWARP